MCPQCGTRDDDWDHGGDDGEDQYAVTVQKCVGCEVIADKQKDLERDGTSLHGIKVGLMPAAVHAALQVEREARRRRRRDDDNE
ncbi:hypothetical protein [Streptomyces sp. t39]|uniref:hypothetical protein n=1 Tax=Streptomyces sp. t39 TaxID=1828156 RepID=UPI0021CA2902|nr:hypothetical protein [Streptomyces sp. t39]